ncbi:MAG: TIM barrel protein [Treponema sp.]|jgi:sugar phosphate isomerase/epimerase|nr:TIM barrel protein [Treponema sp.]
MNEAEKQINYPQIYLAIDNCFAYKRWTRPREWCALISGLGLKYIEAGADNELDPLFMGEEYLADWVEEVKRAEEDSGVRVASLYSGHGTYTTLGLTHTDPRVRRRLIDKWFKPMADAACGLGAGLGFFAHGFPHRVLQESALYRDSVELLKEGLVEINRYAASGKCRFLGIEQMYSPHQYPWTISQTRDLIGAVTKKSGAPFYFTEDVGHHRLVFQKPDLSALPSGAGIKHKPWLGSDRAFALAEAGRTAELEEEIRRIPHLFSQPQDNDCYAWLSELGAYSPVIHLQQTNGHASDHLPFTAEHNGGGIIDGGKVLRALKASYEKAPARDMPPRCGKIYLTLEVFAGTAAVMHNFLSDIRESVSWWRRWIPRDGVRLDELVREIRQ